MSNFECIEILSTNDRLLPNEVAIISNGEQFFIASYHQGLFRRDCKNGLIIQTYDANYIAIGAKKCKTLRTARKWAKMELSK